MVHVEIYAAMLREGPREHEKTCGEPPFSEQPAVQLQVLPRDLRNAEQPQHACVQSAQIPVPMSEIYPVRKDLPIGLLSSLTMCLYPLKYICFLYTW